MIRARRRFGQHFLHDPAVIARILAALDLHAGDAVVEIGPGHGALTGQLLRTAGRLDAIEIDHDLAARLRERFHGEPGFVLHEMDALSTDWRSLAAERGARLRVVGNLPYNISTPLLFRLLECAECITDMHFMLQKEVVDRILAAPATPEYGRLTVMLAPRVQAHRLLEVGAGAFRPAPRVVSSVVRLRIIEPPWSIPPLFARVVAAAFGQRRKTLRNALRSYLSGAQIEALGLDPGVRAEQLPPREFARLAEAAALAQAPGAMLH